MNKAILEHLNRKLHTAAFMLKDLSKVESIPIRYQRTKMRKWLFIHSFGTRNAHILRLWVILSLFDQFIEIFNRMKSKVEVG